MTAGGSLKCSVMCERMTENKCTTCKARNTEKQALSTLSALARAGGGRREYKGARTHSQAARTLPARATVRFIIWVRSCHPSAIIGTVQQARGGAERRRRGRGQQRERKTMVLQIPFHKHQRGNL